MKIKYSKMKNFKIVTGRHLLELEQESKSGADYSKQFAALETLTLGLYLLDAHDLATAKREFTRLSLPENELEKYDIIDNVNIDELISDVVAN